MAHCTLISVLLCIIWEGRAGGWNYYWMHWMANKGIRLVGRGYVVLLHIWNWCAPVSGGRKGYVMDTRDIGI